MILSPKSTATSPGAKKSHIYNQTFPGVSKFMPNENTSKKQQSFPHSPNKPQNQTEQKSPSNNEIPDTTNLIAAVNNKVVDHH
jgi:hypothetical protein